MLVLVIRRYGFFSKLLLSVDGVIDFGSQIENTRDPEVLTCVLHFEKHSKESECLLQSVKNASAYDALPL